MDTLARQKAGYGQRSASTRCRIGYADPFWTAACSEAASVRRSGNPMAAAELDHGQNRTLHDPGSTTDPDARSSKKSYGKESHLWPPLCHATGGNRFGLDRSAAKGHYKPIYAQRNALTAVSPASTFKPCSLKYARAYHRRCRQEHLPDLVSAANRGEEIEIASPNQSPVRV